MLSTHTVYEMGVNTEDWNFRHPLLATTQPLLTDVLIIYK